MDGWIRHARRGELDAAWRLSDDALAARAGVPCWHLPRHLQWVWNGAPLRGRVLVRCYHGLGDTIQFARYVSLLAERGAAVTLWAQPSLEPLLRTLRGVHRVLPMHDGAPRGTWDAEAEVMELPYAFRTTLATIPAAVPYQHAPAAVVPRRRGRLDVGIVWRSGDWDPRRSIPPAVLAPLARIAGVTLHVLQRDVAEDARRLGLRPAPGADTVSGTARLMRAMDLVVTVDSMPAHLAGALGVPVWTLLQHDADWRWMEDRGDSPWYPTMRLFRQPRPGDWKSVVERAGDALEALASSARAVQRRA